MRVALEAGAKVIGVNNRNLHTFVTDMGTTGRLAAMLPAGSPVQLLSLSGVASRADVLELAGVGASAVLVGESLMKAASPGTLLRSLLGQATPTPAVKICGLKTVEAALAAVRTRGTV
jgi:anthranilate synthase/indole-3-glycerol phosphate synthase/phosphoribosylanthranilate isomerase